MEPYETRQERLLEQYYFKCKCELCRNTNDIDIRSALRCQRENCTGAVRYPGKVLTIFWQIIPLHSLHIFFCFTSFYFILFYFRINWLGSLFVDNLESGEMYASLCSVCNTEVMMPLAGIRERQDRLQNLLNLASSMSKWMKCITSYDDETGILITPLLLILSVH
jgi:hypothetical protein